MTEIVRHGGSSDLPTKMEYARVLATSNLLPRQYHQQPANLLFALEYAEALGILPINAITSIHVIDGKPSASADLIAAMIRRAGHRLRVEGNDQQATATLIRADDPEFPYTSTWTLERARAAGLTGKQVWKNYPGAMLRSRAITEVARKGASDALFGVVYAPEELGVDVDAMGAPLQPAPIQQAQKRVTVAELTQQAQAQEPSGLDEFAPGTTSNPDGRTPITQAQQKRLHATFGALNITDQDDKHRVLSRVLARPIESSTSLTKDEAKVAIDCLTDPGDRQLAAWLLPDPGSDGEDALPLGGVS